MNESYAYAFSFTSIRIHNWEEGEGDRREGLGRKEWRHTPACIKNAPNTEGRRWHHCTYVTLAMTSLALSLSSLMYLKHFFPPTLSTPTYVPIPSSGDCVGCVYVLQIEGGHSLEH